MKIGGCILRHLTNLHRNISSCPQQIKSICYKTFVRPVLEYGCCVWDPHQENQILDLEKIQKRAARFATGNHDRTHGSTARNLAILEWPTLKERRAKIKLKILHKAKLGITDIPLSDLISNSITTRRSSTDYRIPQSRLDSHKFSFYPSTIRLWNSLPPNLKNVTDSDSFSRVAIIPSAVFPLLAFWRLAFTLLVHRVS